MNNFQNALTFFGLEENFTRDELQRKFHFLALRYHPDKGEFTSDVVFIQLLECRQILEEHLTMQAEAEHEARLSETENSDKEPEHSHNDFYFYKTAKKIENDAILTYFKSRKNKLRMELDAEKNPELMELRTKLERAKQLYSELMERFPDSMWIQDAKNSLTSLEVWWK
ncbi:MAG TPA: J domain-containing protein [Leptospiraceae bacterium]|nr:J domain-containing protein [Leptospiraceae bacterium]HMY69051.1 J domain-containing protein [Leptospiraceae bacterium]HNF15297.1 J domain-containing protein [Leptospiraceae bacterium]HNI97140.1 J domain-containing protein [Leptospiraceae bacterium]HNM03408.1 J domain-containing protein [Leptospiraceae bacterium]